MQAIVDSIIYLNQKIKEIKGNDNLTELRCLLMGQRQGMIYALQMLGLDFEYTDMKATKGRIVQYAFGTRDALHSLEK